MAPRVVAIVQARQGSSRLPGKSLELLGGRPLIGHVLERAAAIPGVDKVVLATSLEDRDDPLVAFAMHLVAVTRGPEHDVLERTRLAALHTGADVVVRVTGDCPLLAPDVSGLVLEVYKHSPIRFDYLWNDTAKTGWPDGTDTEVFSRALLEEAAREATDPADREHVTPWMRRTKSVGHLNCVIGEYQGLKLSVDTQEDLERARAVYAHLQPGELAFVHTMRAARKAGLL